MATFTWRHQRHQRLKYFQLAPGTVRPNAPVGGAGRRPATWSASQAGPGSALQCLDGVRVRATGCDRRLVAAADVVMRGLRLQNCREAASKEPCASLKLAKSVNLEYLGAEDGSAVPSTQACGLSKYYLFSQVPQ